MLKFKDFFKKPIVYFGIISLIAVSLAASAIIIGINSRKVSGIENNLETLIKYKTPYIGDNSKVGNIINILNVPAGITKTGLELKTQAEPYEIIINYAVENDRELIKDGYIDTLQYYKNSALIFSLIENVDSIMINLSKNSFTYHMKFTRNAIDEYFNTDVREFSKNENKFKDFLNKVDALDLQDKAKIKLNNQTLFNIYKTDEQLTYLYKAGSYFLDKESMIKELPDIIKKEYEIDIKKLSMDENVIVVDLAKNMESELDKGSANAAYKLSILYKSLLERDGITKVKVLIEGKEGVEGNHYSFKMPAVLESDGRTAVEKYFKVQPEAVNSQTINYDKPKLDQAIKNEIFKKNANAYGKGEVQTEGHKILRVDEKEGHTTVYMVQSYGEFGFENEIFTKKSGSGAIPTVMIFAKNSKNEYVLENYKIPQDGSFYLPSTKKMFPNDLHDEVLNSQQYYNELKTQEEAYALEYLKTIGRSAQVKADFVEKILPDINVDAANRLLNMYGEYPYWIGTIERIENGQRYIYEKVFTSKGNGEGTVIFTKKQYNGDVIEKAVIEVKDGKMSYLEGQPRNQDYGKNNLAQ